MLEFVEQLTSPASIPYTKIMEIKTITEKDIVVLEEKTDAISKSSIFKITSQDKLQQANKGLSELKVFKGFIKENKDKIVKPLSLALKNARDLFRPIEEKIDNAEQSVKTEILSYKRIVDEAIEKQKEKIEEKVEQGKTTFDKASQQMEKVETKTEGFKTRKIREVEIVNELAIPHKYWELNMISIRKDALAGKEISGVKVVEREIAIM